MFKSLSFALFWHLWLCWRASYFFSDHLLLKNLLRTLVVVLIMSHSKFKTKDKLHLTFLSLYSLLNFARRKCAEKLRGLRRWHYRPHPKLEDFVERYGHQHILINLLVPCFHFKLPVSKSPLPYHPLPWTLKVHPLKHKLAFKNKRKGFKVLIFIPKWEQTVFNGFRAKLNFARDS